MSDDVVGTFCNCFFLLFAIYPASFFSVRGFKVADADLVLRLNVREFHDLQKAGFFQTLGYCALRISEILSKVKIPQNGELPELVQQQIAVTYVCMHECT